MKGLVHSTRVVLQHMSLPLRYLTLKDMVKMHLMATTGPIYGSVNIKASSQMHNNPLD